MRSLTRILLLTLAVLCALALTCAPSVHAAPVVSVRSTKAAPAAAAAAASATTSDQKPSVSPAAAKKTEAPVLPVAEPLVAKSADPAPTKASSSKESKSGKKDVSAVVESLGALKADDKETDQKFAPAVVAPKGGVRLVKDLLTGKLKPLLQTKDKEKAPDAATSASANANDKSKKKDAKKGPAISAVVAAAMADKDGKDAAAGKVNVKDEKHKRLGGRESKGVLARGKQTRDKDAKPLHISIGSRAGVADVVRDDVLQSVWNVSETSAAAEVSTSLVAASKDFNDFYLWRTFVAGDRTKRVITAQKPFILVANSEVATAQVTSWGPRQMAPVPLANSTEGATIDPKTKKPIKVRELLFGVQYECHSSGRTLVTVVLRLFEMTTGQRASDSVAFSFIKECERPEPATPNQPNVEGNAALPGLAIGTRKDVSDVVVNGEALPAWTISAETPEVARERDVHTYDTETQGTKFLLRYDAPVADANLTVNKAVFLVDEPTVLLVDGSGDLTEQSTVLRSGRTFTLALTFTCKKAGESHVTVALNFPFVESGKVSFSFRKKCSGLVVGDGATMNGIDIWQNENDESRTPEVVENGVVQPEWRPLQNLALEKKTTRTYGAGPDVDTVTFFAKLRRGYHPVEYDAPVVESYSPSGEVILRPTIGGSIQEASKLVAGVPRFLVLAFNCIREGDAVVTIKLPFRPNGAIQFNLRKTCVLDTEQKESAAAAVNEYSTGETLVPLPGINVGHFIDGSTVVENGIPTPEYHLTDSVDDLMILPKKYQWVNFFLSKNASYPGAQDVRFGRPELISTADIARPVISGLGAEGGLITDNEYSTVSVTFHCFTEGNTTLTLVIPLVGDEWLNAHNEPVSIKPARVDPIRISFVKECPSATEEPVIGMGGIGISGFSVGFSANTSELVFNGFPQPKYFGQHNKPKPDWDGVIIPTKTESTTLFLHYNGNGLENKLVGTEVLFQSPLVVAHNPTARPALAGAAAEGGVLVRDGPPLPLDLTFNCRYAGTAVVTVVVPIVPHGQISITIPKACAGDQAPHGVKVSGLHVGTTPLGSEVVSDGQTTSSYVSFATKKHQEHKVPAEEVTTTFYVRKTGSPVRAIEPLIYAHKPIVSVRVEHAMLVNSTRVDDDVDGDEIELNDEPGVINVTYACVHDGSTDITISLHLLPKGQVQWTFEKQCGEFTGVHHHDAGIVPGGLGDADEAYQKYRQQGEGPSNDMALPLLDMEPTKRPPSETDWDSDLIFGPPNAEQAAEYAAYLRKGGASPVPVPASASIAQDGFNPHSALDQADIQARVGKAGLAHLLIGTGKVGPSQSDVFDRSLPGLRYQKKVKASLDMSQDAVVKPDQETSTFYLSTSAPTLIYDAPTVVLDKKYFPYLRPTLAGPAATAGTLAMSEGPKKLEVTYNCARGGVFAVVLRVPVGDQWAVFRVIKICPNTELEDGNYWTAGRVLTGAAFVAIVVGLVSAACILRKKIATKTAANAMYVPVQQTEQN